MASLGLSGASGLDLFKGESTLSGARSCLAKPSLWLGSSKTGHVVNSSSWFNGLTWARASLIIGRVKEEEEKEHMHEQTARLC